MRRPSPVRHAFRKFIPAFVAALIPSLALAGLPLYLQDNWSLPIGAVSNTAHLEQVACGPGTAITALYVAVKDFVTQIQAHCDDVLGGGYTGASNYQIVVGSGFGDNSGYINCGPRQFAVGVRGKLSMLEHRVIGFQLLCGNGRTTATATRLVGHDSQVAAAFSCGPGKVATGLVSWDTPKYDVVAGFGFICTDLHVVAPANGAGAAFIGNWTVTLADGSTFPMTLYTSSGTIVGVYDQAARNGIIMNGTATPTDLTFNWQTTGTVKGSGTGRFRLDDATHLSGDWTMGAFHGTWTAIKGTGLGTH